MWQNTKLLIVSSFFIIFSGLGILWYGLNLKQEYTPSPQPIPHLVETQPVATTSAVVGIEGQQIKVTKVIDGDTFVIEKDITVRMLGVDTPETKDPRKPVECFGKQASNETKSLIDGRVVILQKDVSETDKYGRLLRYVFLPLDGDQLLFVNDYLIRSGFAKILNYPPDVKYAQQFLQAQMEAKNNKRGLWKVC